MRRGAASRVAPAASDGGSGGNNRLITLLVVAVIVLCVAVVGLTIRGQPQTVYRVLPAAPHVPAADPQLRGEGGQPAGEASEAAAERLQKQVQSLQSKLSTTEAQLAVRPPPPVFISEQCRACNSTGGRCFFGVCACKPGVTGDACNEGTPRQCASEATQEKRLLCYRHDTFGCNYVDRATWKSALAMESDVWAGWGGSDDRANEHRRDFEDYRSIPASADLGHVAEFGCGPYTQLKTSLHAARPDLRIRSITLSDPNAHNYVAKVSACSYKAGWLLNPDIPTIIVSAGAEVPMFDEVFDTVIMINVLEHVLNAYDVLENLYRSLKPGGLLIFHDKAWPRFEYDASIDLNNQLHPIRPDRPIFAAFLSMFEALLDKRTDNVVQMPHRNGQGNVPSPNTAYNFIGRKKSTALAMVMDEESRITAAHPARLTPPDRK